MILTESTLPGFALAAVVTDVVILTTMLGLALAGWAFFLRLL